jgi:hypothetical protein
MFCWLTLRGSETVLHFMKNTDFRDMTPCSLEETYWSNEGPLNSILRLKNEDSSGLMSDARWKVSLTCCLRWRAAGTSHNPPVAVPPLFGCPRLLIQYIRSTTHHIWRPFINPQSEDAPCCADKDPLVKIGTGGGILWMPKRRRFSCKAEDRLASQEGICSMDIVS